MELSAIAPIFAETVFIAGIIPIGIVYLARSPRGNPSALNVPP